MSSLLPAITRALLVLYLFGTVGCAYVTRVSVSTISGQEPNADSKNVALSQDGRYTAFESDANNIVSGDGNFGGDIFVRDNLNGSLELISEAVGGGVGGGGSSDPDISPNGRFVVFSSNANNLVANDTNPSRDVFLYDRQTDTMEIVSVDSNGLQGTNTSRGGSVSADGNIIVFFTRNSFAGIDNNNSDDVYVRNRSAGTTTLISSALGQSSALGDSTNPRVSDNGYNIAFESFNNGFTSNDAGFNKKIYVTSLFYPIRLNITEGANAGAGLGDINGGLTDAKVVFSSTADNLTADDTNGFSDIFLTTIALSGFTLVVNTSRVTAGSDGDSVQPAIQASPNGSRFFVAYETTATNLQEPGAMPLDTNSLRDVYVWESGPGISRHRLMSQTFSGELANDTSVRPALSPNGEAIAFESLATDLVTTAANGKKNVYLRPTLVPDIDSATGVFVAGQTSTVTLYGDFPAVAWETILTGDGVESIALGAITSSSIEVTVTLSTNATPGMRNLFIYKGAPQLGMSALLGAADLIAVDVIP